MGAKNIKKNYLEISFLPYLKLKEDILIGNAIIWPYYGKKDIYIKDKSISEHIDKIFRRYVGKYKSDRLAEMAVVSYKKPDNFKPLTQYTYQYLSDSVSMFCFSNLIKNNPISNVSSDSFHMIHQRFTVGDSGLATESGSYIRITTGGLRLGEVLFMKPLYMCDGMYLHYDKKMLDGLENLRVDKALNDAFRKIALSIEWVSYAYTNVDNFNYASRIVMMSTAFEVLLNGFDNKLDFVRKIKNLVCDPYDDLPKNQKTNAVMIRGKSTKLRMSRKEWWAYEFYALRNKIVHGEVLKRKEFRNRRNKEYFGLAINFFTECIRKILSQKGCYTYEWIDEMGWIGVHEEI